MKFLVTEQAQRLNDFKTELQYHQYQIQDNLVRLYCWYNCDTTNHRIQELYAQLNRCPKLKKDKKYPSSDFIFRYIYEEMEDVMDYRTLMTEIESDADIEKKNIPNHIYQDTDLVNLRMFIKEYCRWLSDILSRQGIVSTLNVKEKVITLINKYIEL